MLCYIFPWGWDFLSINHTRTSLLLLCVAALHCSSQPQSCQFSQSSSFTPLLRPFLFYRRIKNSEFNFYILLNSQLSMNQHASTSVERRYNGNSSTGFSGLCFVYSGSGLCFVILFPGSWCFRPLRHTSSCSGNDNRKIQRSVIRVDK